MLSMTLRCGIFTSDAALRYGIAQSDMAKYGGRPGPVENNLVRFGHPAATLDERQRIAFNMHDGLAQTLSVRRLHVDRANELVAIRQNQEAT